LVSKYSARRATSQAVLGMPQRMQQRFKMSGHRVEKFINTKEAARICGVSEQQVRVDCTAGKYPGARKEGGAWMIPVNSHADFGRDNLAVGVAIPEELKKISVKKRGEFYRRLGFITSYWQFAASCDRGLSKRRILELFCFKHRLNVSTFYRWDKNYRENGPLGLIDFRGGDQRKEAAISPLAFEYFQSLYLDPRRPSVKLCLQMVGCLNKSESRGWRLPSLRVMQKLAGTIPLAVQVFHREGVTAYESKCAPYILRDVDSVAPGEVWVGDHHQCNCWVRYRNRWVRPWLTAWQDMRSRMIIGWHISDGPNQTKILLAMKRAIEAYGPPAGVKIDNGKDYDSEMFTGTTKIRRRRALNAGYIDEPAVAGIYAMMSIGVSFAIPYNAKAKPIERTFDTIDRQFCKNIETYCGKDVAQRPEAIQKMLQDKAVIARADSLDTFAGRVGGYIVDTYNRSPHTGEGMDGRSPEQVMNTRASKRVFLDGSLDLLMKVWSGELTVGKNGVRFRGLWYGQYNQELLIRQDRKVRVAYDPDDVSRVWVYDSKTMKLITEAEQAQMVAYGAAASDGDVREGMRMTRRAKKVVREYCDASLTANMDTVALAMKAQQEAALPPTQPPDHPGRCPAG